MMIAVLSHTQIGAAENHNSKEYKNRLEKIMGEANKDLRTIGTDVEKNIATASLQQEKDRIAMETISRLQCTAEKYFEEIFNALQQDYNEKRSSEHHNK